MSLLSLLDRAARDHPEEGLWVWGGDRLSHVELRERAAHMGGGLGAAGVSPDQRVPLCVDNIADFFVAFWGVLHAGATPVPISPPRDAPDLERVRRIVGACDCAPVVDRGVHWPETMLLDVGALAEHRSSPRCPSAGAALVQYSSGSSRDPHGIVLSHANLLANVAQMVETFGVRAGDIKLTWMPHFHDMGLIGCHLLSLAHGIPQIRMQPRDALRDGAGWLRAASESGATLLSTTNFAMARANRRLPLPLDLSRVRIVFNGAEPISGDVCREFSRLTGIPEEAHRPLYGLAEASVAVAAADRGGVHEHEGSVIIGPVLPGMELRFVEGELLVRGPNVAGGEVDSEGWLHTGDEGRIVDGRLVVTGRRKDVIVHEGAKHHAHDVEAAVENIPGVKLAVAVADRRSGAEELAVVYVGEAAARSAIRLATGAAVVIQVGSIPRTTSGKKKRAAVRAALGESTRDAVRQAWRAAIGREVDDDTPFRQLGGTSLVAIDVLSRIATALGVAPDHRVLLHGDTVRRMADWIDRHDDSQPAPVGTWPSGGTGVAVVAAACRFPGANDLTAFWSDHTVHIRPGRTGETGGELSDIEYFDADRFGIGPEEAAAMDPQQRILLTLAADAWEDAGKPSGRVGIWVGAGQSAYASHVQRSLPDSDAPPGTLAGNLLNMLAARVAHHLDFHGPALTVDTACSASLVALHLGAQAVASGEVSAAIVGGVNLNLEPSLWTLFDRAGALSPTRSCRPFSEDADGMVPGEGAAVVVLVPNRAGLDALGVIRASAINNDGASLGVMAPNPAGQEAVLRAALATIPATEIAYVEAHGTGTPVGDAVELSVLRRVYPHAPPVGSVKQRIGHALGAAGIAGFLHALGKIQPAETAAVSSFGFGGTNAHVLVQKGSALPVVRPQFRGTRFWFGESDASAWLHRRCGDGTIAPIHATRPEERATSATQIRHGARVLILGGTGGIGKRLAQWLRARFDADVTALGSGGRAPGHYDIVFHLAGRLADPWPAKRDVLLAARGEVTAPCWVLFSSMSAVISGLDAGIEEYAAANRWLLEYAHANADCTAIAWPPWEGAGMADGKEEAFRERGIVPISAALGWDAMLRALESGERNVVILAPVSPPTAAARDPIPAAAADADAKIRAILARAAGAPIGDDETFTRVGIDSLTAMEIVREIEEVVGRKLPPTLLYQHPTLATLLAALDRGLIQPPPTPAGPTEVAPPASVAPTVVPLTPAQAAFFVQRRFFPDIPGNVFLAVTVDPPIARDTLQRRLSALSSENFALRCVVRDGALVPIGPAPIVRWGAFDEDELFDSIFDLEAGPLLRVWSDGRRVALDAHHLALDAWSLKLVMEALLTDRAPIRADWPDAAAAIRNLPPPDMAVIREQWRDGVPPLPIGRPEPARGPGRRFHTEMPVAPLESHARNIGVTLPALVLAAYARALFRVTGQHDVVIRVAHGGRTLDVHDVTKIVGSFADSSPLRVIADAALDVVARRVHEALRSPVSAPSVALAGLIHRADAPAGFTPAGFSFPLLQGQTGDFTVTHVRAGSASGFTGLGLIAWTWAGELHCSWNWLDSAVSETDVRRVSGLMFAHAEEEPQLHRRILSRCARHPERRAVGALSYGALGARSAAVANAIDVATAERRRAHHATGRIAVLAAPSEDAIVAILGILRTGNAYVPLDPTWPPARVSQILTLSDVDAIVVTESTRAIAPPGSTSPPQIVVSDAQADAAEIRDGPLAWVMFTSGSTGAPKGVEVSHTAALRFLDWVAAMLGVTDDDRFIQTSSLGFGGSIRQMFSPLLAGATIVPTPAGALRDPDALVALLDQERITVWNSVPTLWMRLLDASERAGSMLPSLRWVLLGGEAVPAAHVLRWRARFGNRHRLANLYGSTETVVNASWFEVTADPDDALTPIGRARSGLTLELEEGEIIVRGAIAEGYLGGPRFHGTFRTGDLGRHTRDGNLVFTGRRDRQVQVHGNRVELGEVEATLVAYPGVTDALALWDGARLVATVTTDPGCDVSLLRPWLQSRLPAYMVPALIASGTVPRTPTGKLIFAGTAATAPPRPTTEPVHQTIAALWQRILRLPTLPSTNDDFFELGGDSISILDLADALRDAGFTPPSALALYAARTLAAMASIVRAADGNNVPYDTPSITGRPPELTAAQRHFLTAHANSAPPIWTALLPLRGPIDVARMQGALNALVARHPALRTRWRPSPELVFGVVPLQYDDARFLADPDAAIASRWGEARSLRLDPARWPAFSVRLIQTGDDAAQLLLAVHHVVADAWSAWVLAGDLLALHDGLSLPPLMAPPTERASDVGWWASALSGLNQPAGESGSEEVTLELPAAGHARVLTALFRAIHAHSERSDLAISVAHHQRDSRRANAVGSFAVGVPVRAQAPFINVSARLADALAHAPAHGQPSELPGLGRYFFTWLDPDLVPRQGTSVVPDWAAAKTAFATASTRTELMVTAQPGTTLRLSLRGGTAVHAVAKELRRQLTGVDAALVVYAPAGMTVPSDVPLVIETVDTSLGRSELVLLPLNAAELPTLDERVFLGIPELTSARVVALAGMLPAHTGLAMRPLWENGPLLTTGHAATVAAMALTVEAALRWPSAPREWRTSIVGVLGYGSIGKAVLDLCRSRLGEPRETRIRDPRVRMDDLSDCDIILGATSGGVALDVATLRPGTIVVDDSFPRAFSDDDARRRMEDVGDVLLVGGGQLDVGPIDRSSPFPQAVALRERFGARWLPGCHAEAILIASDSTLGATTGPVDLERSQRILAAVLAAGWRAAPLHLGTWRIS